MIPSAVGRSIWSTKRDGGWMGEGRPAGGHALAMIPNATHYSVFASPVLVAAALGFLDAAR